MDDLTVKNVAGDSSPEEENLITELAFHAIAVRTRQELTDLVDRAAQEILHFDNVSIFLVDTNERTHVSFFFYSREANVLNDNFIRVKQSAYPVKDGFFDVTLHSDTPVVWDLAQVAKWEHIPERVSNCMNLGTNMITGMPIIDGEKRIGNIFMGYKDPSTVTAQETETAGQVSSYFSRAVISIHLMEENSRRLAETNTLLQVSNALFKVKSKTALSHTLFHFLKFIDGFLGYMIITGESESHAMTPYLLHFDKAADEANDTGPSDPRPAEPGISLLRTIFSAGTANDWTMKDLMNLPSRPIFLTRHRTKGVKKIFGLPLADQGEIRAALFLFGKYPETFQPQEARLISLITQPLARALNHVIALEQMAIKDTERDLFLATSRALMNTNELEKIRQALQSVLADVGFFDEGFIYFFQRTTDGRPSIIFKTTNEKIWTGSRFSQSAPVWEPDQFLNSLKQVKDSILIDIAAYFSADDPFPAYVKHWKDNGIKTIIAAPFLDNGSIQGIFIFLSKHCSADLNQYTELIRGIAGQISGAVNYAFANKRLTNQLSEINQLSNQLQIQNNYLQEEIRNNYNFNEMVGTSTKMRDIFHMVFQVAQTNSTVLILGETGTGKELIARAIHNSSSRKGKVMIKVNCGALPANLIESELFGHERGSFTGATERRIGKFELANNSTLFLDEIGELPLAMQVKLLRVLQEKEIERLGGTAPIKVNVRVIAATNRDLFKEVQKGEFRGDLYFRLNVFPMDLPPLRERKEDVAILANHFAQKYAKRKVAGGVYFTSRVLKQMTAYNWPGNVRELEHLVERSILLAKGKTINQVLLPCTDLSGEDAHLINKEVKTIDEVERDHIIAVLKMVDGKISGVGGAAEILKISASTLASKIKKLKIKKGVQ